ncbi:MAG TPA: beta galactosidase jelly roll domain-containing protein, partial [Pirellulales bacterium]|nr:beta galactosidase jelly roll domain-containing protein [Pirellulales bacterium]
MRLRIVSRCLISLSSLVLPLASQLFAADWQPAQGPLQTRWAKDVSPENALPEYPRPQMVRKDWQNLNGLWDYAIRPKADERAEKFDGLILVPFPVESALSGVMKRVDEPNRLWYRRTFAVPKEWAGKNVLLHFGAVNWEASVWVNGKKLGEHRGGYDGFTFDITSAIKPEGEQEIVVSAWNPIDAGTQPRGKQVRKPGGIFYTPTTGIWQTAWIEPVPQTAIDSVTIVPDIDKKLVRIIVKSHGDLHGKSIGLSLGVPTKAGVVPEDALKQLSFWTPGEVVRDPHESETIEQTIDDPKLWSPDLPYLYGLRVHLSGGEPEDDVKTYFGMRKISIAK